ncbi:glutaredoxin 3 [Alphaproteobacteria bacterium]|nr:glutaredoxin 3 [Alphaproteobacteria bacterium]MDC0131336.1 glutaredoxin 3 [Alphaproteobacteria bacterium]MDC0148501.1 glutaredoxin 3 [Alphaproteobacteria bacterium]
MSKIEIYTTKTCPFCHAAKELLDEKNISYIETDVGADPALRAAMKTRASNRNSVPQIFIDDVHIGGCDDLFALQQANKLDALVAS